MAVISLPHTHIYLYLSHAVIHLRIKTFISASPLPKLQYFLMWDVSALQMQTSRQQFTCICSEYTSKLKITKSFDWSSSSCLKNHSQNIDISKRSIGRQKLLNCQCEGAPCFKQVRILIFAYSLFHFENHLALLTP